MSGLLEVSGWLENRIFVSTHNDLNFSIRTNSIIVKNEIMTGASIRTYSNLVGRALAIVGFAIKIKVHDQDYYVNNNSLAKFVYRYSKVQKNVFEGFGFFQYKTFCQSMHQQYKTETPDSEQLKLAKIKITRMFDESNNWILRHGKGYMDLTTVLRHVGNNGLKIDI